MKNLSIKFIVLTLSFFLYSNSSFTSVSFVKSNLGYNYQDCQFFKVLSQEELELNIEVNDNRPELTSSIKFEIISNVGFTSLGVYTVTEGDTLTLYLEHDNLQFTIIENLNNANLVYNYR